jgi:hypothetical protein
VARVPHAQRRLARAERGTFGWRRVCGDARRAPIGGARPQVERRLPADQRAALVALVVSLGSLARLWLSAWGALLVLGVVVLGILIPLALYRRPGAFGGLGAATAAVLVLLGGFLLRVVLILSSEGV